MNDAVFPRTLEGWLGIIAQTFTIFAAVSAVFHWVVVRPLLADIKEIKETDIRGIKETCATTSTKVDDLKEKTQASEFDRAQLHQDVGRVQGVADRNAADVRAIREEMHNDQMEIVERLARIEANVNIAAAMERIGERLVSTIGRDK